MPILLTSDLTAYRQDQSRADFRAVHLGALQAGWQVLNLPDDQAEMTELLTGISVPGPVLFSGYLLSPQSYRKIAAAVAAAGRELLISPAESLTAMRFDSWYPLIDKYTARSLIIDKLADCEQAGERMGYPLFVKGQLKSRKEQGPRACLAYSQSELKTLVATYVDRAEPAIIRQLLPLRAQGTDHNGFPISREYRVFIYQDKLIGSGFYWSGKDPFGGLTVAEKDKIIGLARLAGERISCPLLAVDVAQLKDGRWKIIEIGDPQFARINQHLLPISYFSTLAAVLN